MNNTVRRVAALLIIALIAALYGCTSAPLAGNTATQAPQNAVTYVPILPASSSGASGAHTVTLYFRYMDEELLSTESREITVPQDTRIEKCIIEELIAGPNADHPELTAILSSGVRVLDVSDSDGLLYVTLSKEFLATPANAPEDWENDSYWSVQLPARRLLALEAMVCALTDLGEYGEVQLLVDGDNEGDALPQRVPIYYFYSDVRKDESALMDNITRNESIVLTPRGMLREAMAALLQKDWERLYTFVAAYDEQGQPRPVSDSFVNEMQALNVSLLDSAIGDAMTALGGNLATVCMDATFAVQGAEHTHTAFPVRLVRLNETWKITYPMLKRLLAQA